MENNLSCTFGHPVYDTFGILFEKAVAHHMMLHNVAGFRDAAYREHKNDKKIAGIKALRTIFLSTTGQPLSLVAAKNEFEAQARLWDEDPLTRSPYAQAAIDLAESTRKGNLVKDAVWSATHINLSVGEAVQVAHILGL